LILTKIYEVEPLSLEAVYKDYVAYGERLAPYVHETTMMLDEALAAGKQVLLEGGAGHVA